MIFVPVFLALILSFFGLFALIFLHFFLVLIRSFSDSSPSFSYTFLALIRNFFGLFALIFVLFFGCDSQLFRTVRHNDPLKERFLLCKRKALSSDQF